MDIQTNTSSWGLTKIEKEGSQYLGIPIGSNINKYFFGKLAEFKKTNGWIVKDDVITEWKIEGFYNEAEHSYFYGAYHNGLLLRELLREKPGDWKNILLKLAAAYSVLTARGINHFKIYTISVYFLDEGGVLFLPPDITEEIIALSQAEVKLEQKNIINHPDLKDEAAVSYTLGVLSYKSLTTAFPFQADNEDEIRYYIRNRKLVPLYLSVPGLKKEESQFIMTALCQSGSTQPPAVKEWVARLELWQKDGLCADIPQNAADTLKGKANEKQKKLEKSFRINLFFHKYKWVVLVVSVVVLVIMLIAGTSIYNIYFKPRSTIKLSPQELVQAYYKSLNSIDFYTLEDCVIDKAGKDDITEIVNIYVLTKQQSALQMEKPTIDPDEWTRRGRPQLRPGLLLYGITGLTVKELARAPEPAFEAEYEKWYSEFNDVNSDTIAEITYHGSQYKDRLYLKIDRGGWVIYRLDREKLKSFEYQPD